MNIVQSFWSKPAFHADQNYSNSRGYGGWSHERWLWLSTAYSFYCAKRHHRQVHLVTDSFAYNVLIDRLGLPYNDANASLDILEVEDHRLWILGKVMALKNQPKPFVHVENDVFLYQPLPTSNDPQYLIAQSRIRYPDKYRKVLKDIFGSFRYVPEVVRKQGIPEDFSVINIGIIGGNDVHFFNEYCALAENFVNQNKAEHSKIDIGLFSNVSDEYLFSCLVKDRNRKINLYIDVAEAQVWNVVMRFNLVPFIDKYIHLQGLAKKNAYACEQMEYRFRFEFPEEYKRISSVLHEMCPPDAMASVSDELERWEQVRKVLAVLYDTNVESLLCKKVQLRKHVQVKEQTNEHGENVYRIEVSSRRSNGEPESWKLEEKDEALFHFSSPVCINELLEGLRAEGFIHDEDSATQYRFKLIDFVTEKMTIDGVLEFA